MTSAPLEVLITLLYWGISAVRSDYSDKTLILSFLLLLLLHFAEKGVWPYKIF